MSSSEDVLGFVITDGEVGAAIAKENHIKPWSTNCGKNVEHVHYCGPERIAIMRKAIEDAGEQPPDDTTLYVIVIAKYLEETKCSAVVVAHSMGMAQIDLFPLCQQLKNASITVYGTASCEPIC